MKQQGSGMRRRVLLATLLACLLLQMPASLLPGLLESACAGQCRLSRVSGPWWQGRGELFLRHPVQGHWLGLGELAWHGEWGGAGPGLVLHLAGGSLAFTPTLSGWRLLGKDLVLPADWMGSQPWWSLPAAGWQGQLRLASLRLEGGWAGPEQGQALVLWEQAATSLLEFFPLGDFRLELNWQPQQGLVLHASGGQARSLSLQAKALLQAGQRAVTAELRLQPLAQQVLGKYLTVLGRAQPEDPGHYRFSWR